MINTHKLELPLSRTYFYDLKVLQTLKFYCMKISFAEARIKLLPDKDFYTCCTVNKTAADNSVLAMERLSFCGLWEQSSCISTRHRQG